MGDTPESAAFVRKAIDHAGISQSELARRAGVSEPTVSQWLSGVRRPSVENLLKVAAACGMEFTMTAEAPAAGDPPAGQ